MRDSVSWLKTLKSQVSSSIGLTACIALLMARALTTSGCPAIDGGRLLAVVICTIRQTLMHHPVQRMKR